MKKISEIKLPKLKRYDTFEAYCAGENTTPSQRSETAFFRYTYFGFGTYEDYTEHVYESLGASLSPDYVYTRLTELFPQTRDHVNVTDRDDNVIIKFKSPEGLRENPDFKSLLNRCNWYLVYVRREGTDRTAGAFTFCIEPRRPDNRTDFIYNDCGGYIYKIVPKRKLDNILKFGLKPGKTSDVYDNANFRNYFLANTTDSLVKDDIVSAVDEIQYFKSDIKNLRIIKIDLNKLNKIHGITVQAFVDSRMNVTCYWTGEYIPGSCISDVTEGFINI